MTKTEVAAPSALIADDNPDVLAALRLLLKGEGFQTEAVNSPALLLEALQRRPFDLVLMDLNYTRDTTSGREGLDLLAQIRAVDEVLPVVAMTAWGSIELAVETMRNGVNDFILKPWDNAKLLQTLQAQLAAGRARRQAQQLQSQRDEAQTRELAAALEIQRSLLPREIPTLRGCQLATAWQPVRNVSGDFFNVLAFGEQAAGICIGDVAGKGMPAALVMSNAQALVKVYASVRTEPRELCEQVNRALCNQLSTGKFVTFFYAVIEPASQRLRYTNAGHNPPLLVRRDGACAWLEAGGTVLGVFSDGQFAQGEIQLASGDRVVLFTDGLTEALDADGGEFSETRLQELILANRHLSANELQQRLMAAVREFCAEQFQDDATLLVLAID